MSKRRENDEIIWAGMNASRTNLDSINKVREKRSKEIEDEIALSKATYASNKTQIREEKKIAKKVAKLQKKHKGLPVWSRRKKAIVWTSATLIVATFVGSAAYYYTRPPKFNPIYQWEDQKGFPKIEKSLEAFDEAKKLIILESKDLSVLPESSDEAIMSGIAKSFLVDTGLVEGEIPEEDHPDDGITFEITGEREFAHGLKTDATKSSKNFEDEELPESYTWAKYTNFGFTYKNENRPLRPIHTNFDGDDEQGGYQQDVTFEASEVEIILYEKEGKTSVYRLAWQAELLSVVSDQEKVDDDWTVEESTIKMKMIEGLEILHRPEEEGPAILEDEPEEDEFDYIVDSYIFRDTAYYEFNAYFHKDPAPDLDEREREGLANLNLKQWTTTALSFQKDIAAPNNLKMFIYELNFTYDEKDSAPQMEWNDKAVFLPVRELWIIQLLEVADLDGIDDKYESIDSVFAKHFKRVQEDSEIASYVEMFDYVINDDTEVENEHWEMSIFGGLWVIVSVKYVVENIHSLTGRHHAYSFAKTPEANKSRMIGFIKSVLLQLGIAPRVVADLEIDFETTQFIDPGVGPPQPQEFRGTIAIDDSDENKQTIDFKTTAFVFNGPLPTE